MRNIRHINIIILASISSFLLFSFCSNTRKHDEKKTAIHIAAADTSELKIIQRPVLFDSLRRSLSLEYIREHYGINKENPTIDPEMIVIHHTAIDNTDTTYNRLYGSVLPDARKEIKKAGLLNVSAHYLVAQDGTVYQLLPDSVFARHVIGLNMIAIGIENVGGLKLHLTQAQLEADAKLVRYLKQKHPGIKWMIGHKEYGNFRNTSLWEEKDNKYFTFKDDPMGNFMEELRAKVNDLGLKSNP